MALTCFDGCYRMPRPSTYFDTAELHMAGRYRENYLKNEQISEIRIFFIFRVIVTSSGTNASILKPRPEVSQARLAFTSLALENEPKQPHFRVCRELRTLPPTQATTTNPSLFQPCAVSPPIALGLVGIVVWWRFAFAIAAGAFAIRCGISGAVGGDLN